VAILCHPHDSYNWTADWYVVTTSRMASRSRRRAFETAASKSAVPMPLDRGLGRHHQSGYNGELVIGAAGAVAGNLHDALP
jgi:hypothetical protein